VKGQFRFSQLFVESFHLGQVFGHQGLENVIFDEVIAIL
jgi:hypothetical protein